MYPVFVFSQYRKHQSIDFLDTTHNTTISFRFTVSEMKRIYRGFKTECPTGLITEEAFQGIYSRFFPHGGTVHFHSFYLHFTRVTSSYRTFTIISRGHEINWALFAVANDIKIPHFHDYKPHSNVGRSLKCPINF